MELKLNSENFEKEVLNSNIPVLVDFYADWCGPCKMLAPIIEKLEEEVQGKAKVGKVNVDDETEVAEKYGIMSIPTLILFKNGEVVKRASGARGKAELKAWLED